jgi:cysteine synthase
MLAVMTIFSSALEQIGNTPLVHLSRIHTGAGRVLAKLEFVQPGGSIKDRPALKSIRLAQAQGVLRSGQAVVEMTSGNMGAGLAVVCGVLGHPFTAVMSAGNSIERVRMLEGLGARVVRVPQIDGEPGRVTGADIRAAGDAAQQIALETGAFFVDQFQNPASALAHEQGTGPEIWTQTGGRLDAFVAIVGSGGSFVGTSRFLKRMNSQIVCAPVEPEQARPLAGIAIQDARHVLQGAGYGSVPPAWDAQLADEFLFVSDQEALEYRRLLAAQEGLYVGFSAAANVCAAIKLLESGRLPTNATVVTLLCDTGLKYA